MFVVGKNYRLQNIQLSKSGLHLLGAKPPSPRARSLVGPLSPTPLPRSKRFATLKSRNCLRRRPVGCATNIAALTAGLKPATTKQRSRRRLQRTRRSCYAPKLFCQRTPRIRYDVANPPSVATDSKLFIRPAFALSRFGVAASLGLPSRSPARGGGWWRIPGSNR